MHLVGVVLFLIGIYGIIVNRHLIKMIVAINVMEVGLNIFIIAVAFGEDTLAPILRPENMSATNFADPLPQALVLTAIVIGVGTTAVMLTVARKLYQQYGTFDIREMEVM